MPAVLITKETAHEIGKRGALKRTENMRAMQAQAARVPELERELAALRQTAQPDQGYIAVTITRLRERNLKLIDQIDKESDPQELQRLATAFDKLSEVEQKLSMRPLPGSLRPTKKPTARSSNIPDPVD